MPKTRRWIVRVSDADDRAAREKARSAGLSLSAYVRRMGADGYVVPPDPLYALVAALNRAGNLVNQQLVLAHTRGFIPESLLRLDEKLEAAIDAVLAKYSEEA
jgi:hypothetical protein